MKQILPDRVELSANRVRWIAYGLCALALAFLMFNDADDETRRWFPFAAPLIVLYVLKPRNFWVGCLCGVLASAFLVILMRETGKDVWRLVTSIPTTLGGLACLLVAGWRGSRLVIDRDGFALIDFWRLSSHTPWSEVSDVVIPKGMEVLAVWKTDGRTIEFQRAYGLSKAELGAMLRRFHERAAGAAP